MEAPAGLPTLTFGRGTGGYNIIFFHKHFPHIYSGPIKLPWCLTSLPQCRCKRKKPTRQKNTFFKFRNGRELVGLLSPWPTEWAKSLREHRDNP